MERRNPSLRSGQASAKSFSTELLSAQVSNLRGEAANWKQQTMIVVRKLVTKKPTPISPRSLSLLHQSI